MKKTFILGFAWMLSMLLACGCGKSDSSTTTAAGTAAEALAEVSAPTKVETTTAPKAEPLDLRGLWISDERADNTYMVADIRDNGKIGVFFIMEGDKTPWTYWIGTYDAPDKDTKTYSWVSKNTHEGTGLLASPDSEKKFTYDNGILKCPMTVEGRTGELYLIRGEWDNSSVPASVYGETEPESAEASEAATAAGSKSEGNPAITDQRVYDAAELFSADQAKKLESEIGALRSHTGIDAVVVTTAAKEGKSTQEFAEESYYIGGFGEGNEKSGFLYLIDMEDRVPHITTVGGAITIFSDSNLDKVFDDSHDYLSNGDYAGSVSVVLSDFSKWYDEAINMGYVYDAESGIWSEGTATEATHQPAAGVTAVNEEYINVFKALLMDEYTLYEDGVSALLLDWEKTLKEYKDSDDAMKAITRAFENYMDNGEIDSNVVMYLKENNDSPADNKEVFELFSEFCKLAVDDPDKFREQAGDEYSNSIQMWREYGYFSDREIGDMIEDLEKNALRASKKYSDKQILLEGVMSSIDASGKYFVLTDGAATSFRGCTCKIKNDKQLEKAADIDVGDKVYVLGTITDVGESLAYFMDITEIFTPNELGK